MTKCFYIHRLQLQHFYWSFTWWKTAACHNYLQKKDIAIAEGRVKLGEKLGRALAPTEVVVYIDGNELNINPSNLALAAPVVQVKLRDNKPTIGHFYQPDGYAYIKVLGDNGKYVKHMYARYLMQHAVRRVLLTSDRVCHKDGDRSNNEIDNLIIKSKKDVTFTDVTSPAEAAAIKTLIEETTPAEAAASESPVEVTPLVKTVVIETPAVQAVSSGVASSDKDDGTHCISINDMQQDIVDKAQQLLVAHFGVSNQALAVHMLFEYGYTALNNLFKKAT